MPWCVRRRRRKYETLVYTAFYEDVRWRYHQSASFNTSVLIMLLLRGICASNGGHEYALPRVDDVECD